MTHLDFYEKLDEVSVKHNRDNILLSWVGPDASGLLHQIEDGWRVEHYQRFRKRELRALLNNYGVKYDYIATAGHFCFIVSKDLLPKRDKESALVWANEMRERWGAGTMIWSAVPDSFSRAIVVFSVVDTYRLRNRKVQS